MTTDTRTHADHAADEVETAAQYAAKIIRKLEDENNGLRALLAQAQKARTTTDAEYGVLEAALDLAAYHKANSNGYKWTVADYIGEELGASRIKAWKAFEKALDAAMAAENPCDECNGTAETPHPCCTGDPRRIECGCGGQPTMDACSGCDGRGWVL